MEGASTSRWRRWSCCWLISGESNLARGLLCPSTTAGFFSSAILGTDGPRPTRRTPRSGTSHLAHYSSAIILLHYYGVLSSERCIPYLFCLLYRPNLPPDLLLSCNFAASSFECLSLQPNKLHSLCPSFPDPSHCLLSQKGQLPARVRPFDALQRYADKRRRAVLLRSATSPPGHGAGSHADP